jgi:hypothetical protein
MLLAAIAGFLQLSDLTATAAAADEAAAAVPVPMAPPARDLARAMNGLVAAYPDFLAGHDGRELIWRDGTRMAIEDGQSHKTPEVRLEQPDIEDMFYAAYYLGAAGVPPGFEEDPGRVRYEPLFRKMYGDCRSDPKSINLIEVPWLPRHGGGTVSFTRTNGAAAALARVSSELDTLEESLVAFALRPAGTFNCRVIEGTSRLSMHAYGAAIDIDVRNSNYWRWEKRDRQGRYPWKNRIPMAIVRIFEKHGFIWGGKWYHFDTMHFEYRPELIAIAIPEAAAP